MNSFKFEVWPVKDIDRVTGYVVTRPVGIHGEIDEDGNQAFRNFSKVRENLDLALKDIEVAIADVRKGFKDELAKK